MHLPTCGWRILPLNYTEITFVFSILHIHIFLSPAPYTWKLLDYLFCATGNNLHFRFHFNCTAKNLRHANQLMVSFCLSFYFFLTNLWNTILIFFILFILTLSWAKDCLCFRSLYYTNTGYDWYKGTYESSRFIVYVLPPTFCSFFEFDICAWDSYICIIDSLWIWCIFYPLLNSTFT